MTWADRAVRSPCRKRSDRSRAIRRSIPAPVAAEIATARRDQAVRAVATVADRSCSTRPRAAASLSIPSSSRSSSLSGRDRSSNDDRQDRRRRPLAARAQTPSCSTTSAVSRDARRVDKREREPADVGALGQQIARRAGNRGHDRAIRVEQRVEQARLADVRRADDRDRGAFADKPAARRLRQQRVDARDHAGDRPRALPSARRSDSPRRENPATPRASR